MVGSPVPAQSLSPRPSVDLRRAWRALALGGGALVLALGAGAAGGAGAGGAGAELDPDTAPAVLGPGVRCTAGEAARGGLISFAGWTVPPAPAWAWTRALLPAAALPRGALVCSVQGPRDAGYRHEDLDTPALLARLGPAPAGPPPAEAGAPSLTVVAHSSGAFVAQRWLRSLPPAWQARVRYFNLDGGIGSGERAIDRALIEALHEVHAVWAGDGRGGESANAAAMRALHALAPERVRLQRLPALEGVCAPPEQPRARWCLHQVLIVQRPARSDGFDLERDYGEAAPPGTPGAARPVQDAYLRAAAASASSSVGTMPCGPRR